MKKLLCMQIMLLLCGCLFAQNVQTVRYPQGKGIKYTPVSGETSRPPIIIDLEGAPSHQVPDFEGTVPRGVYVYDAGGGGILTRPGEGNETASPAPCINYQGLNDNETAVGLTPPDVNGAVGPNHVIVALNNGVRIQDLPTGNALLTNTLAGFFAPLAPVFAFDPKVLYDQFENRWILTCPDATNAGQSRLLLAVSQGGDPLGGWNFFAIDVDPANATWFDYPSIGFNRNWIVITGNMFGFGFDHNAIFAINKLNAYAGILNVTGFALNAGFGTTLHPALTYDNAENTEWLANNWNGNNGFNGSLRLYNITGPVNAPVFNVTNFFPTVNMTWSGADQNINTFGGCNLRAIDARIRSLVLQGGSLWAVQKIGLPANAPTRASTQWWEINPANGNALQVGRIDDPTGANMFFNPSLAVNNNRDVLIGYSHFSNNAFPRAAYAFRRGGDPANTLLPNFDYRASNRMECTGRWGDYSSTVMDPNGTDIWTIQQYVPDGFGSGTWWSMACPNIVTCPPAYVFTTPISSPNIKYEVSQTITASSLINQPNGFVTFDAGQRIDLNPGFNTNITAGFFNAYIDGCGGLRISNEGTITRTETVQQKTEKFLNAAGMPAKGFRVYPNPADKELFVRLPGPGERITFLKIIDAAGRIVAIRSNPSGQSSIDISGLAKGVYFLEVKTNLSLHKATFVKK